MSRTNKDFDQAIFLDDGFHWKGRFWPTVSGGSESNSDSGDGGGTETENSDEGKTGDEGKVTPPAEEKLTQEQVNAIVAREVAKAGRGKLDPKELGFESGKELKEFLDKQKQVADEAKTQADKDLEAAIDKAKTDAEAGVLSKANTRLIAADFKVAAKDAGVISPNDALVISQTMDIWQQVELIEEGDNVTVKGFDESFFKVLKDEKPFLFAPENAGGDAGAGAGGGKTTDDKYSPSSLAKTYSALQGVARQRNQREASS